MTRSGYRLDGPRGGSRLDADEWQHGQQLPTVRELADHYGVSTRTIHNAYRTLAADDLIVITPGWGTHRA